jgi:nucleotide-binding universal stress UspA family protein
MLHQFCIPVTDEPVSLHAARAALDWAKRLGAKALLVNVVSVPPLHGSQDPERVTRDLLERSEEFLESWHVYAQHHTQDLETLSIVAGKRGVAQAINETATARGCDLIAMGTHALEGINRALLGSVAEAVVHHATVPVLLFRQGIVPTLAPYPLKRVMVAVDGSLGSDLAVRAAAMLCAQSGARVGVLHVIPDVLLPVSMTHVQMGVSVFESELHEHAERVIERAERDLETVEREPSLIEHAASQPIAEVILAVAARHHADLLVLGTEGRGGLERLLLGSVAESVAHHAAMPVLLVRGSSQALDVMRQDKTAETEFTVHAVPSH